MASEQSPSPRNRNQNPHPGSTACRSVAHCSQPREPVAGGGASLADEAAIVRTASSRASLSVDTSCFLVCRLFPLEAVRGRGRRQRQGRAGRLPGAGAARSADNRARSRRSSRAGTPGALLRRLLPAPTPGAQAPPSRSCQPCLRHIAGPPLPLLVQHCESAPATVARGPGDCSRRCPGRTESPAAAAAALTHSTDAVQTAHARV
nr:PREDICTED: uncharacterized protein LOC109448217 [Rhinolophus sinicus]